MNGSLSLCLIVKDEERDLPACLESAAHLAEEIIVVDTGSTDGSKRIAADLGARVLDFDFTRVDFAAARNHAIAQAREPWILMLDADETLDPLTAASVKELASCNANAGFFFERHNPSVDYVVRLFPRRPEYRYRGRVHETIDDSILLSGGELIRTAIRLQHRFGTDLAARRRKNHWYIQILMEEIAADPTDRSRLDFLAAEYHQLEMFAEATAVAEQIAQMRPLDARAHLFVGTYHLLYEPDFEQARRDFERALELKPGYAEAESFLRLLAERQSTTGK